MCEGNILADSEERLAKGGGCGSQEIPDEALRCKTQ